jgi:hypothetical protein
MLSTATVLAKESHGKIALKKSKTIMQRRVLLQINKATGAKKVMRKRVHRGAI